MTALIVGANGFIGRRLFQPGDRGMVRHTVAAPSTVCGDLLDFPSLVEACQNIETVFHCAGYAHAFSSSDPDAHRKINYEGTRNLLTAAVEAGVRRFVFLSSVKAMAEPGDDCIHEDWPGEPLTPYGRAKRASEDAVLDTGAKHKMHVVNLRLSMVYGQGGRGNLNRMADAIRSGWFPPLPDTGNHRSLVHVQDVVEVMRLVADHPQANGQTYIVSDSRAYSAQEIYEAIRVALGKSPAPMFTLPAALLLGIGRMNSRLGEVVDRLISSACYSPSRIEHELGWRARIGLTEGLQEMLSTSKELR